MHDGPLLHAACRQQASFLTIHKINDSIRRILDS